MSNKYIGGIEHEGEVRAFAFCHTMIIVDRSLEGRLNHHASKHDRVLRQTMATVNYSDQLSKVDAPSSFVLRPSSSISKEGDQLEGCHL